MQQRERPILALWTPEDDAYATRPLAEADAAFKARAKADRKAAAVSHCPWLLRPLFRWYAGSRIPVWLARRTR